MIKPWTEQGVRFKREKVTQENLGALLSRYMAPGDLIIDLAWNIDCCELLEWCRDHGVLYINSSVEVWDPYEGLEWKRPTERTLYFRHMNIRRLKAEWHDPGPTAVLEHGANPGLISHWTKKGILDIAVALVADRKLKPADAEEVQHLSTARTYNRLAQKIGIRVIHCSERDTQIAGQPKEIDEFVNTWSIEGFHEEGTTTAEMGWGTHENDQIPRKSPVPWLWRGCPLHASDLLEERPGIAPEHHHPRFRGSGGGGQTVDRAGGPLQAGKGHPGEFGGLAEPLRGPGRPDYRPGLEHRLLRTVAMVPRPRRALYQYVGRGLGPLRRPGMEAAHGTDALFPAHEYPPFEGRMARSGADGRPGTRRQPRADLPLDQERPAGHRRRPCWPSGSSNRPTPRKSSTWPRPGPSTAWPKKSASR